jgi:hypothetical protein
MEWISVNERLPIVTEVGMNGYSISEPVAIVYDDDGMNGRRYGIGRYVRYSNGAWGWEVIQAYDSVTYVDVDHWMPLPPMPANPNN